eukprot:2687047-Pyramimonas_sp.AAC.1
MGCLSSNRDLTLLDFDLSSNIMLGLSPIIARGRRRPPPLRPLPLPAGGHRRSRPRGDREPPRQ